MGLASRLAERDAGVSRANAASVAFARSRRRSFPVSVQRRHGWPASALIVAAQQMRMEAKQRLQVEGERTKSTLPALDPSSSWPQRRHLDWRLFLERRRKSGHAVRWWPGWLSDRA